MQICAVIYRVGRYDSSCFKGLTGAVALMGICDDFMAEPFCPFGSAEREKVRKSAVGLGLLPAS